VVAGAGGPVGVDLHLCDDGMSHGGRARFQLGGFSLVELEWEWVEVRLGCFEWVLTGE